jgi:hypothetical protein
LFNFGSPKWLASRVFASVLAKWVLESYSGQRGLRACSK